MRKFTVTICTLFFLYIREVQLSNVLEPVLKTQSIIITINDIEVECRAICLFKVTPPDWNL